MKSTLSKKEGLQREISVEIPQARVAEAFDRAYKGLQKSANIKGFRKGKAPLAKIRSLYGDRVKSDVLESLVGDSYNEALAEHQLNPITQPRLNFDSLNESESFSFKAEFEIRPEVSLKKIEGLKVQKEKLEVSPDSLDEAIENIRKSKMTHTPLLIDRPAQLDDIAEVDFSGFVDGQPLPNGSAEKHALELGSNSFIDGFEEGIVGMLPGQDREIQLKFPDDYHAADIAGKPVTFKVKLHKLMKKSLPDLDDEFAKSMGEFENVEAFKKAVEEDIRGSEENRIREDLKQRILKVLVAENPVEVPDSLLGQQKAALVQDVDQKMRNQGMGESELQEYKAKWDQDFTDTAKFMIQSSFLVDKLAADLKLSATEQDIVEKINIQAQSMGMEPARLLEYYSQSHDRKSQLAYQISEEKVVDHLIDKGEVKEVDKKQLKD